MDNQDKTRKIGKNRGRVHCSAQTATVCFWTVNHQRRTDYVATKSPYVLGGGRETFGKIKEMDVFDLESIKVIGDVN